MCRVTLSFYVVWLRLSLYIFFFFNDTATTEIYTLSLHDALPILRDPLRRLVVPGAFVNTTSVQETKRAALAEHQDRKSTRLNSSHLVISYAVFCLKKKKKHKCCLRQHVQRVARDTSTSER